MFRDFKGFMVPPTLEYVINKHSERMVAANPGVFDSYSEDQLFQFMFNDLIYKFGYLLDYNNDNEALLKELRENN